MFNQRRKQKIIAVAILAFSLLPSLFAHPIVPGLELTKVSPELKGRVLLEELNCAACHKSDAKFSTNSKKSPRLSDIGSRLDPKYMEAFISDPHGTKPGTTMPDALSGLAKKEKEEAAKSLTHFLMSLKKNNFKPKVPDLVSAKKGERFFHAKGCVSCHSPRDSNGNETMAKTSAPLGDLTGKYSHQSLVKFLQNPHAVRPSGRMPKLDLPYHEVNSIAEYLLQKTKLPGNLSYTLYNGSVAEGLKSDGVKPVRNGHIKDFSIESLGKIRGQFAVEYEGWLNIANSGEHTFFFVMNGGSFSIDGKELLAVEPSKMRGTQKLQETIRLEKGRRKVKLVYYHTGRKPTLALEMSGPEFKRSLIPSSILSVSDSLIPAFKPFKVDTTMAKRGRQYFSDLGCASCHDDLKVTQKQYVPFANLTIGKGCLSKPNDAVSTKRKHPHFNLNAKQLELVTKHMKLTETKKLSDRESIQKSLLTFNCVACHERKDVGGISQERLEFFTGTHPELGDQGRLPPTLSHVGAKLKPDWIRKVLVEGKRQRPYMNVVMPSYGADNVGHLTEAFGKVDKLEKVKFPKIENIKESKNAGYDMIGPKGFSCVACHNFNGANSSGAGALDLVNINKSLKKSWFHLFMQNPSRFHTTGIMPSFWPGGKSIRPDVLDGKPDQQIEALWTYLSDGPRAKKPLGLSRQSKDIRVFDKAEIVRGRSPVGYRGIGVGYPERLNLAFDADEMALRLLWKDGFAKVNFGSFKVSGKDQIEFPQGIPFHRLKSMDANWPYKSKTNYLFPQDHGYQFRGYHLDALRRPTFRYQYGEVAVEDFFEDVSEEGEKAKFKRTFTFNTPKAQELFYFRAAVGKEVKAEKGKLYQIDKLRIRIVSDNKAIIRKGNPSDLLIPLKLPKGKSKLTIEYQW